MDMCGPYLNLWNKEVPLSLSKGLYKSEILWLFAPQGMQIFRRDKDLQN